MYLGLPDQLVASIKQYGGDAIAYICTECRSSSRSSGTSSRDYSAFKQLPQTVQCPWWPIVLRRHIPLRWWRAVAHRFEPHQGHLVAIWSLLPSSRTNYFIGREFPRNDLIWG